MSGSLIASIGPNFDAWMTTLRPASFRGVPFYYESTGGKGGRRLVTHEFALRDRSSTQDLGRAAQRHTIQAWVIGADYAAQRDALISACQDYNSAATLVHPTMGELICRAGPLGWSETIDKGGLCALTIEFVEDGAAPSPTADTDTASLLLGGIVSLQTVIATAYAASSLVSMAPQDVLALTASLLTTAGTACAGLAVVTPNNLAPLAAEIAAGGGDRR